MCVYVVLLAFLPLSSIGILTHPPIPFDVAGFFFVFFSFLFPSDSSHFYSLPLPLPATRLNPSCFHELLFPTLLLFRCFFSGSRNPTATYFFLFLSSINSFPFCFRRYLARQLSLMTDCTTTATSNTRTLEIIPYLLFSPHLRACGPVSSLRTLTPFLACLVVLLAALLDYLSYLIFIIINSFQLFFPCLRLVWVYS